MEAAASHLSSRAASKEAAVIKSSCNTSTFASAFACQLLHVTSQAYRKRRQEAAPCEQEQGEEEASASGKREASERKREASERKREARERKSNCEPCDRSLLPR